MHIFMGCLGGRRLPINDFAPTSVNWSQEKKGKKIKFLTHFKTTMNLTTNPKPDVCLVSPSRINNLKLKHKTESLHFKDV